MAEKDFDTWNEHKKKINSRPPRAYNAGEAWWVTLGLNIGSEQDGKGTEYDRPALIIKKINRTTCLIIPLTTSHKHTHYQIPITLPNGKESYAIISQLRMIDTRRLKSIITKINSTQFETMRKAVRNIF